MSDVKRLALDHLVLGVPDLEKGVADVALRTGLTPMFGGHHASGTANYLVGLGHGAYLEILGLQPDARESGCTQPFGIEDVTEDRLLTWSVRSARIEDDASRARSGGYDVGEIVHLSRTGPDGVRLRWKMSRQLPMAFNGVVPFLMDWGASPHPSTRGLPEAALTELLIWHPDAGSVGDALEALRAPRIQIHSGAPQLVARIDTPNGLVELG